MHSNSLRCVRVTLSALATAVFFLLVGVAVAGPPLICHSFDIGNAKSLPWVSHDWNLSGGENYDTHNLVNDTLTILSTSTIPLVHMETLRRATLYARKDPVAAKELLVKLVARAQSSEASAQPDAFALFDAGYVTETYKQWLGEKGQNPANGLDGRERIKKADHLRGNDPQMKFAAALVTLQDPQAEHLEYARAAAAGAKADELLARNLATRFLGGQSPTMAEMILRGNEMKVARQ
ncbi:MAG TPA: hypothetical protein VIW23_07470 [Candidatus Acidoferrum sp.]